MSDKKKLLELTFFIGGKPEEDIVDVRFTGTGLNIHDPVHRKFLNEVLKATSVALHALANGLDIEGYDLENAIMFKSKLNKTNKNDIN